MKFFRTQRENTVTVGIWMFFTDEEDGLRIIVSRLGAEN